MVYKKIIMRRLSLVALGMGMVLHYHTVLATETNEERIAVTRVKVEPVVEEGRVVGIAKVMLNECIVVRDIKVIKDGKVTVLRFPEYVSKRGTVYPQIKFLTEEARNSVVEAVETGKPSSGQSMGISFKITDWFRLKGKGMRKVNAEVTFNSCVAISCGIMEGKRGRWIAWPSIPPQGAGRRWMRQIYIANDKIRRDVENQLLNRYEATLKEKSEEW